MLLLAKVPVEVMALASMQHLKSSLAHHRRMRNEQLAELVALDRPRIRADQSVKKVLLSLLEKRCIEQRRRRAGVHFVNTVKTHISNVYAKLWRERPGRTYANAQRRARAPQKGLDSRARCGNKGRLRPFRRLHLPRRQPLLRVCQLSLSFQNSWASSWRVVVPVFFRMLCT